MNKNPRESVLNETLFILFSFFYGGVIDSRLQNSFLYTQEVLFSLLFQELSTPKNVISNK